jgi:hypothetical protein
MATRPAPSYEQTVDIETPELVVLTYSIAGVGSRVLAGITDLFICLALLALLSIAALVLMGRGWLGGGMRSASGSWALAVLAFAQFAVLWGYYVLF